MDVTSRVQDQTTEEIEEDEGSDVEECSDPYLVEKIVKKRFRNNQYEYLVKWYGYTDSDNTWELPSNIPDKLLTDFETKQVQPSMSVSQREGLRQNRKIVRREDYVLNM